jgi:hypothetical protein
VRVVNQELRQLAPVAARRRRRRGDGANPPTTTSWRWRAPGGSFAGSLYHRSPIECTQSIINWQFESADIPHDHVFVCQIPILVTSWQG